MNYKVLYRKYRPNNFETIIGQDYIVKTLKNSIVNNEISHAYIFSGPRGTGKTSTAKVFAKAINCLNPIDGSPCEKCEFCNNFVENPDVIEIDAASNNGVDEIRNLIDNVKLTPTNGKYKVYIIDEVHMLTTSAFNALLLTLEEPPAHAIFILATTNIESVPITILSRCQRFDFQKISVNNLVSTMKDICEKESIKASDDALEEIAYLSDGGLRDSLSLLDQLSKNKDKITVDIVDKQIKTISRKEINELLDSIENNDIKILSGLIESYENRSIDYKTIIKKTIDEISNRAKKIKSNGELSRLSFKEYKDLMLELASCITKINVNVNPYTVLEMIFLNYMEESTKDNKETKVVNEEIKEERVKEDKTIDEEVIHKDDYLEELMSIRINNSFVDAQKSELQSIKSNYKDVTEISQGKVKSVLVDSNPVVASSKYILFSSLSNQIAMDANNMLSEIEKVISDYYHKKYSIIFVSNERWEEEKSKYIFNIKNGNKYSIIKEPKRKKITTEPIIDDIFDRDKIEIV